MVDIQEKAEHLKVTIALLVDKTDFLTDIQKARDDLQISELLTEADNESVLGYAMSVNKNPESFLEKTNEIVAGIRRKYSRTINHDSVIKWVLLTNTVPTGVFTHASFHKVQFSPGDEYQYTLVLDPRASKQDVLSAYDQFRHHLFGVPTKMISRILNQGGTDDQIPSTSFTKSDFEAGNLSANEEELYSVGEELSKGSLYASANTEAVATPKNLDFNRKMYWLRYEQEINRAGTTRTNEEVLDQWEQLCPQHRQHSDTSTCPYCSVDSVSTVQDAIAQHKKLLSNDF